MIEGQEESTLKIDVKTAALEFSKSRVIMPTVSPKSRTEETNDQTQSIHNETAGEISTTASTQGSADAAKSKRPKNWLFLCYCLGAVNYGCLETAIASLFSDITEQLGTSEMETSWIVLCRALSYIVSTFVGALCFDKTKESHRYYALVLIVTAVATAYIPYSTNYFVQMALWSTTGYAHGTLDTALPVYAYRGWTDTGSTKYVTFLAIKGATNTITPLMIQFTISKFNDYSYSLFGISAFCLIGGLVALFLPTPQHDSLRSIQAELRRRSSAADASDVKKELEAHVKLRRVVVFLWCWMYVQHGFVQSGFMTHATLYVSDYMGHPAGTGRFLIAMYCGGQVVFRVLHSVAPQSIQKVITSVDYMIGYLSFMVVMMTITTAVWLFIPLEYKLYTLWIVFPVSGFVIGGIGPYAVRLVESVTPVTGVISCIFMAFCGAGDFLVVLVNGKLIQIYGAQIQPAAISAYCLCALPILALTVYLYRTYRRMMDDVVTGLNAAVDAVSRKNGSTESEDTLDVTVSSAPSAISTQSDVVEIEQNKRLPVVTASQTSQ